MNHSTLSLPTGETSDSLRNLVQKVASLLRSSPYDPVQRLICDCIDDVLVIRGRVPTQHQKKLVNMLLSEVARKALVRNEVVVASSGAR